MYVYLYTYTSTNTAATARRFEQRFASRFVLDSGVLGRMRKAYRNRSLEVRAAFRETLHPRLGRPRGSIFLCAVVGANNCSNC